MFKDIISREHGTPWPATGMTTLRWMSELETSVVQISDLIATQPGVLISSLIENRIATPIGGDPYPHVIKWEGQLYLEDGHHRVLRALMRGQAHVVVRLLDMDERTP